MKHASLFSGIGGFDLAARWCGWENVLQVEKDPFCQRVLRHHFPEAHLHADIQTLDAAAWRGRVDVLSGGFPCQPFSSAGQRRGTDDDRFLWPEMLRVIREIRPAWVVAENVRGLASLDGGVVFERVCADLEADGYAVQPFCIPALAVGAPHRRDRFWFIAHNERVGGERRGGAGDVVGAPGDPQGEENKRERRGDAAVDRGAHAPDGPRIKRQRHKRGRGGSQEPEESPRDGDRDDAPHSDRSRFSQPGQTRERELPAEDRGGEDDRPELHDRHAADAVGGRREGSGLAVEREQDGQGPLAAGCGEGDPRGQRPGRDGRRIHSWEEPWPQAATRLCRVDDGLPRGLDGISVPRWRRESLKAYGNAIVPQIAYQIFSSLPV